MKPVPHLYLNRNPRSLPPGSIVCAKNMMIDENGESLVTDSGIEDITSDFPEAAGALCLAIPAIGEVVYVCANGIYRYNETTGLYTAYTGVYKPNNSTHTFVGDYYYNVRNELIISIAESSEGGDIPLVALNLDNPLPYATGVDCDIVAPFMPIVSMSHEVTSGRAKKGEYHFFIRFTRSDVDKTKWKHIGYPVTLHSMGEITTLFSVFTSGSNNILSQCSDVFSDDSNVAQCNFNVTLTFGDTSPYVGYEIACIINSADGLASYIVCTNQINNGRFSLVEESLRDVSMAELLDPIFSIKNVKHVCNHDNRLYIADYKEDDNDIDFDPKGITVRWISNVISVADDIITNTKSTFTMVDPRNTLNKRLAVKTLMANNIYQFFIHFCRTDGSYTSGIKLINDNTDATTTGGLFGLVTNTNGDKLFRVPSSVIAPDVPLLPKCRVYAYSLRVSGVEIPDGFVGFFISYAVPEDIVVLNGIAGGVIDNKNIAIYSSTVFRDDRPSLSNCKVVFGNFITGGLIPAYGIDDNVNADAGIYTKNYQVRGFNGNLAPLEVDYPQLSYQAGGMGTVLNMSPHIVMYTGGTTVNPDTNRYRNLQIVKSDTASLYTGKNKRLIPCSPISADNAVDCLFQAMPAFISWDALYVTDVRGVMVPPTISDFDHSASGNWNRLLMNNGTRYAESDSPVFVAYNICHNPFLFETKRADLKFTSYIGVYDRDDHLTPNVYNKLIAPMDANRMVKYDKYQNVYCPVDYTEHVKYKRLAAITNFTRTIRRSKPMQDESIENNWLVFNANNYKVIQENKGKITNMVSLGVYLLVHCEHSLFLFDSSNTLANGDDKLQFAMPDLFDIGYKEVFTSKMGFAGLQDEIDSNIDGEFGYIFYDYSAGTIYRFDGGKLVTISDDIMWVISYLKPRYIIMTYDNVNDRVLMCLTDEERTPILTISYSTRTNSFISMHDYVFDRAYWTKESTYLARVVDTTLALAKLRNDDASNDYGAFFFEDELYPTYMGDFVIPEPDPDEPDEAKSNEDNTAVAFYIDVLWNTIDGNPLDNAILLDSVRYVSNKYKIGDAPANPTELASVMPYSADYIKAYSDAGDMDEVPVSITAADMNKNVISNWKKPMYDKGYYTFNTFRFNPPTDKLRTSDNMRYVYGKYVVVRFIFMNDESDIRVRLESVKFNCTLYR